MVPTLDTIALEVLERVALFVAQDTLEGPPRQLIPLLLINRRLESSLSLRTNPHLYASIFASKFDATPLTRRLKHMSTVPVLLASELKRRFIVLQHVKRQQYCLAASSENSSKNETISITHEILWTAYTMMLENEGYNEKQLRYVHMERWLSTFCFDATGASNIMNTVLCSEWPANDDINSLSMWLLWLLLRVGSFEPCFGCYRHTEAIAR
jgi:hypothetical protein